MINTSEPFFHPITHQLVPTGAWYDGAAHLEHENTEPEKTDGVPAVEKNTSNKSGEK